MDDLNYLYHRQQVSLMMAQAAPDSCSRASHNAMAKAYESRIGMMRIASGADELSLAD
ncbi:hypothetical protein FHS96_005894 [Sphingomonas zeicaulis]|uniref:hypothetical protein n=1 Tax=Sphingomonas zeicaulis TaxID=1632740 RepID=UPI003D25F13A